MPACFNPRTHGRCDDIVCTALIKVSVSIHAPMEGATLAMEVKDVLTEFQSTHP